MRTIFLPSRLLSSSHLVCISTLADANSTQAINACLYSSQVRRLETARKGIGVASVCSSKIRQRIENRTARHEEKIILLRQIYKDESRLPVYVSLVEDQGMRRN